MKGVYYRKNVTGFDPIPDITDRIWDVADYVVPSEVMANDKRNIS